MMIHPNRFAGKVAIVTGAAQGIGLDVALHIAREGGSVAMVDRSELVAEVCQEAETAGAKAIAIVADLETFAGATTAVDSTLSRFGQIDILINNVGGTIWANMIRSRSKPKSAAPCFRPCGVAERCCRRWCRRDVEPLSMFPRLPRAASTVFPMARPKVG
jgi:dihydroxycyclohexadiene carboxylate dehydrogenase